MTGSFYESLWLCGPKCFGRFPASSEFPRMTLTIFSFFLVFVHKLEHQPKKKKKKINKEKKVIWNFRHLTCARSALVHFYYSPRFFAHFIHIFCWQNICAVPRILAICGEFIHCEIYIKNIFYRVNICVWFRNLFPATLTSIISFEGIIDRHQCYLPDIKYYLKWNTMAPLWAQIECFMTIFQFHFSNKISEVINVFYCIFKYDFLSNFCVEILFRNSFVIFVF